MSNSQLATEPPESGLRNPPMPISWKCYLIALYLISWAWILLASESVFWDDWILIISETDRWQKGYEELGVPLYGWMHQGLLALGPWAYRVVTLVCWLTIGFLWDAILRRAPGMDARLRFLAAAVVLLVPLYSARYLLVVTNYTLSLTAFVLAWYLLVKRRKISVLRLIGALPLLALSYTSNQLLPFTIVIVISMVAFRLRASPSARSWLPTLLLLVPIIYFPVSRAIQPREGLWANAYQMEISSSWFLLALTTVGCLASGWLIAKVHEPVQVKSGLWLSVLCGSTLLGLGVLPYWLTNRTVTTFSWLSRNQLLLAFGVSLLMVACALLLWRLLGRNLGIGLLSLVLVGFILADIYICRGYIRDWRKQEQLISLISQSPQIRNATLIFFDDQTLGNNLYARGYTWFEWNALLMTAFGEETRFGVSESFHLQQYLDGQLDLQFSDGATTNGAIEHARSADGLLVRVVSEQSGAAWDFPTYKLEPQGVLPIESLPLDRPYSGRDN